MGGRTGRAQGAYSADDRGIRIKFYIFCKFLKIYNKLTIFYNLQSYFDMRPYYEGQFRDSILRGIDCLCAERYRDKKCDFKKKWFTDRGGVSEAETLRQAPPPHIEPVEWSKYIDFFCGDRLVKRSISNTQVRAQQVNQSLHGRTSYAQYLYQHVSHLISKL